MRNLLAFACLASCAVSPAMAEVIGIAKSADDIVTGSISGGTKVIRTSTEILQNERLKANATGNAQIELLDGTKIVVGPGADVTVDDFVYKKTSNEVSALTIRATKGAFRFITGASDHSAYKIVTPYASIGVRGTAFDVNIRDGGAYVALLQGEVTVCDRANRCRKIDDPCTYTFASANGVSPTRAVRARPRAARGTQEVFPLLANQRGLRSEFRRQAGGCEFAALDIRGGIAPQNFSAPAIEAPAPQQEAPSGGGNPGNDKSAGNAGQNPDGSGNFGNPGRGKGG